MNHARASPPGRLPTRPAAHSLQSEPAIAGSAASTRRRVVDGHGEDSLPRRPAISSSIPCADRPAGLSSFRLPDFDALRGAHDQHVRPAHEEAGPHDPGDAV